MGRKDQAAPNVKRLFVWRQIGASALWLWRVFDEKKRTAEEAIAKYRQTLPIRSCPRDAHIDLVVCFGKKASRRKPTSIFERVRNHPKLAQPTNYLGTVLIA